MRPNAQVVVLGGGPAGSTAAALLARQGIEVVLLEREKFPRYHIGESLPPAVLPVLDLLGARQKVDQHGFQVKRGAYFEWGDERWAYNFGELTGQHIHSWQVIRSEFDRLLLEHAAELGVQVHQLTSAREVKFERERAVAVTWDHNGPSSGSGRLEFDYLIDASGRAGVLAMKTFRNRRYHATFQNVGIWAYWADAPTLPDGPEGAISVISIPDGWFWYIPLHDGTYSVGVVVHKSALQSKRREMGSLEAVYQHAIEQSPTISAQLTRARRISRVHAEGDYSYAMPQFAGSGWFASGDAACFLDPLLSTGVHLAMFSGVAAAACVASAVRGDVSETEATAFYDESYRRSYLRFLVLVSTFYGTYSGKDAYFWQAQQLSRHDYSERDLGAAFLEIVSGLEDFKDTTQPLAPRILGEVRRRGAQNLGVVKRGKPLADMAEEEREQAAAKLELMTSASQDFPQTPTDAVGGLWMRTTPTLGLVRNGDSGNPVNADQAARPFETT